MSFNYFESQLKPILNDVKDTARIQILGPSKQTKWLNISKDQLQQIVDILTVPTLNDEVSEK